SPAPDPPDTFIVGVNGLGDVGVHDAEGVGSALNPAKTISIPPGGSHTIQTDLTAHGLGLLNPGRYEVWAEDENESLNAQPVVFSVRFTSESVDALAKIAGDVTADGFRRQWCAHWLSTIDPDFHLHLPAPGDSADARANKNAGNERAVRSFRAFWAKAKGLKQTKRKLEEVNRDAGVPDAEGAATKPYGGRKRKYSSPRRFAGAGALPWPARTRDAGAGSLTPRPRRKLRKNLPPHDWWRRRASPTSTSRDAEGFFTRSMPVFFGHSWEDFLCDVRFSLYWRRPCCSG